MNASRTENQRQNVATVKGGIFPLRKYCLEKTQQQIRNRKTKILKKHQQSPENQDLSRQIGNITNYYLPKSGKPRNDPNGYRPISLLSAINQLHEIIIYRAISS